MTAKRLAIALLFGCVLSAGLQAQTKNDDQSTRSVQGIVSEAGGRPVQGAVVQLKDMKTLQIRSFYTEADGSYHFAGLSTNVDYELKASHQGSESSSKTLSVFDGKKNAVVNMKLK